MTSAAPSELPHRLKPAPLLHVFVRTLLYDPRRQHAATQKRPSLRGMRIVHDAFPKLDTAARHGCPRPSDPPQHHELKLFTVSQSWCAPQLIFKETVSRRGVYICGTQRSRCEGIARLNGAASAQHRRDGNRLTTPSPAKDSRRSASSRQHLTLQKTEARICSCQNMKQRKCKLF